MKKKSRLSQKNKNNDGNHSQKSYSTRNLKEVLQAEEIY